VAASCFFANTDCTTKTRVQFRSLLSCTPVIKLPAAETIGAAYVTWGHNN
jgi:hypothetical protein